MLSSSHTIREKLSYPPVVRIISFLSDFKHNMSLEQSLFQRLSHSLESFITNIVTVNVSS